MLPAAHRLRSAADFTSVTRRGRRVRCGSVLVYLLTEPGENPGAAQVGLVVGKVVGNSVVRHQVSRRLRAQLTDRLDRIPTGAKVVVRALPEISGASSAELGRDLNRALDKLTGPRPVGGRSSTSGSSSGPVTHTSTGTDTSRGRSGASR